MKRLQARKRNGRFTRNTLENTFGLSVEPCRHCRSLANVHGINEPAPVVCVSCGENLGNIGGETECK